LKSVAGKPSGAEEGRTLDNPATGAKVVALKGTPVMLNSVKVLSPGPRSQPAWEQRLQTKRLQGQKKQGRQRPEAE
jgi:hypothetical protein